MSSINLDLDFQDYTPTTASKQQKSEAQTRIPIASDNSTSYKNSAQSSNSILNVLNNIQSGKSPTEGMSDEIQQMIRLSSRQRSKQQKSGNWGLGYFAQYFDVTTDDVLQRILWSAVPIRKSGIDLDDLNNSELTASLASSTTVDANNPISGDGLSSKIYDQIGSKSKRYSYIERFIQSRPDFYGPFWITTTLIFAIAIFSNLLSFMKYRSHIAKEEMIAKTMMDKNISSDILTPDINQLPNWHYDMDNLSMATSVVTFYVIGLPTFLWFLFWFRGCTKYYTLSETICAYGYSLSIFIPVCALLMIQAYLFRYLILAVASILTSLVLVMSFMPMIQSDPHAGSHTILIIVPACQLGLAYIMHRMMLQ